MESRCTAASTGGSEPVADRRHPVNASCSLQQLLNTKLTLTARQSNMAEKVVLAARIRQYDQLELTNGGMAHALPGTAAAQGDVMEHGDIVTNYSCLPYDDASCVIH